MERISWIFWDTGYAAAPKLVRQCIDSWTKFNPGYAIYVLNQKSLFDFIEFPKGIDLQRDDIPVQKVAAISRLLLLEKYGGIWTDATVHCCRPLDAWLPEYLQTGFFCFRNPGQDRLISNWLIAAESDNLILRTLRDQFIAFFRDNHFSNLNTEFGREVVARLKPMLQTNVESTLQWHSPIITKGLKVYPYFIFHYTFNKIILENEECRALWEAGREFSAKIPHALQKFKAGTEEARAALAVAHIEEGSSPVYKLDWRADTEAVYWSTILQRLSEISS